MERKATLMGMPNNILGILPFYYLDDDKSIGLLE